MKNNEEERPTSHNGVQKVPCTRCGTMILPSTAESTGGLCMICKKSLFRFIPFIRFRRNKSEFFRTTRQVKYFVTSSNHSPVFPDKCVSCCGTADKYFYGKNRYNFDIGDHSTENGWKVGAGPGRDGLFGSFKISVTRDTTGKRKWYTIVEFNIRVPYCNAHNELIDKVAKKEHERWKFFLMPFAVTVIFMFIVMYILKGSSIPPILQIGLGTIVFTVGILLAVKFSFARVPKIEGENDFLEAGSLLGGWQLGGLCFRSRLDRAIPSLNFSDPSSSQCFLKATFEFTNVKYAQDFAKANNAIL